MSTPNIRQATKADSQELADLIATAFRPFQNAIPNFPDVTDGLSDSIEHGNTWALVEVSGVISGGLVVANGDNFLKIQIVAVSSKSSGRGYGKLLMQFAERLCADLGLAEMRLTTHILMPQNVTFYKHLGWDVSETSATSVSMFKPV